MLHIPLEEAIPDIRIRKRQFTLPRQHLQSPCWDFDFVIASFRTALDEYKSRGLVKPTSARLYSDAEPQELSSLLSTQSFLEKALENEYRNYLNTNPSLLSINAFITMAGRI
jgi:hypothetical protein